MPTQAAMSSASDITAPEEEEWANLMQKDFHHPYVPYHVQRQFMSTVYKCLEEGKVGVLESPTGTVSDFVFLPSPPPSSYQEKLHKVLQL